MPTYDYVCDACDHEFELLQSIKDSAKKKCPECGKLKLRRLFGTGAAIIFKGSGFYQTDYRSENYKKRAEAEKKENSGGGDGKSTSEGSSSSDSSKKSESSAPAKPSKPNSKD